MTVKKPADLIASLVLMAVTGTLYYQSLGIEVAVENAGGPRFFPLILIATLGLLSLALACQSLGRAEDESESGGKGIAINGALLMQVALVAMLAAYLVIMPLIGYVPSTIAFLIGGMGLLGGRTPKDIALYAVVSAVSAGILYYIFGELLYLFLP